MEYYNTKTTREEIENGVEDEFGVVYSLDGKKLLKCKNPNLQYYFVRSNTEVICDYAFDVRVDSDPGFVLYAREIILPDSLKVIGKGSFSCLLDKIELPEGLLCIKERAFFEVRYPSLTLPSSLLYIGDYAFKGFNLEDIKIPKFVIYIGKAPFNSSYLKKIIVDKENKCFTTCHGLLCNKDLTRIIQVPMLSFHKLNIPPTILSCDCGAFSKGEILNAIPEKFINKWKLYRMKEILSTLINKSCGIKDFFIYDIAEITTIKLSNSLYCNMIAEYDIRGLPTFYVGEQINLLIFFNALGFHTYDIAEYLNIIEEVVLTKENYSQYLGRKLARFVGRLYVEYEDVECYIENEDTGELEQQTIKLTKEEGYLDPILNPENIEDIINHGGLEEPLTIYLISKECYEKGSVYCYFEKFEDMPQEDAIELVKKYTPHLLSNFIISHSNEIFHALIETASRHYYNEISFNEMHPNGKQFHDKAFIYVENDDTINWTRLIDEFFSNKFKRIRSGNFTIKHCWKLLEKFLIAKGISYEITNQFVSSFSFIFTQFEFTLTDSSLCYTFQKKIIPELKYYEE